MLKRFLQFSVVLFLCLAVGLWWATQTLRKKVQEGLIEKTIIETVYKKTGVKIELGEIHLWAFPILSVKKLRVQGLSEDVFRLEELRVRLDVTDYLKGILVIDEIRFVRPEIFIERLESGDLEIKEWLDRIKAHRKRIEAQQKALNPESIELEEKQRIASKSIEVEDPEAILNPKGKKLSEDELRERRIEIEIRQELAKEAKAKKVLEAPVRLRKIRFEDASLRFRDHGQVPGPFLAKIDHFNLLASLPKAVGKSIDLEVSGDFLGAPLQFEASIEPLSKSGRAEFSLLGLPLGAVQPYLKKRAKIPVDLGEIPLDLLGQFRIAKTIEDFQLQVKIPESTIGLKVFEKNIAASFSVDLEIKKNRLRLRAFRLGINDALRLLFSADIENPQDPMARVHLKTCLLYTSPSPRD